MSRGMRWALLVVLWFPAVVRADGFSWGIGLRTTAQGQKAFEGNLETALIGGGLQARFRFGRHWGLEVALEALRGETADGAYERRSTPLSLSTSYHLDCGAVDLYFLAGFAGMTDQVTYLDASRMTIEEEVEVAQFHLGAGVEGRIGKFGLGAEVRALAFWRKEEDMASPFDAIPKSSGGAQLNFLATYYF